MAIAPTFQKYLIAKNVVYDVVAHEPTKSSMRTAETCGVSADCVAKAVVLRDEYGYVLAILSASHHIRLEDLRMQLGLNVDLAAEYEIEELFDDCMPGAIPPVGECYGLDTVVDDSIEEQPEVYLEGGDHATLVHMSHAQFASDRVPVIRALRVPEGYPRQSCVIGASSTPSTTTPPITVRGTAVSPNRLSMMAWTRGEVASRMLYLM